MKQKIPISEIFSSLQGEGPYSGDKQIFVRIQDCNLNCAFCDEKKPLQKEMTLLGVLNAIEKLIKTEGLHRAVSWTGGEPLLYPAFLKLAMRAVHALGHRNYLETNGTLPEALFQVMDETDIIAMDMKLPSLTGEKVMWQENETFLKIASQKEVFVKVVLSRDASFEELDRVTDIIDRVAPETLLVIQPLSTEEHPQGDPRDRDFLEAVKERALLKIKNVKVIPRLHKVLNLR